MFQKIFHFLKYNNAVPIGLSILLLSTGAAMAASPDAREMIISSTQSAISVDNSYIVSKDLATYVPTIQITGVTEDTDTYYVAYDFTTIDVDKYVWKDVTKEKILKVAKASLQGTDLGLYATRQLKEVVDGEIAYLKRVQDIEKAKGVQMAVVATAYSGLVGKFLDVKEEIIPGYEPVIIPPPPEEKSSSSNSSPASADTDVTIVSGAVDQVPPTIYVLGNNPAQIPAGASYLDLGAVITDNVNKNLGYQTQGAEKIDTSAPATFTVTYTATDQAGNTRKATRTVIVYDPKVGPPIAPKDVQFGGSPPEEPASSSSIATPAVTSEQTTDVPIATTTADAPTATSTTPVDTEASSTAESMSDENMVSDSSTSSSTASE